MAKPDKQKKAAPAPLKGKKGKVEEPVVVDPKLRLKQGRATVADSQSWTGKLPGSLLHEYCQKQKWEKVQYDMVKTREGFVGVVNLAWKNPKTHELITVKMMPEKSIVKGQETSLEARHYAATYALHRIAFGKNLHMVLPTNHKNLWSDLEAFRKQLLKDNPSKANELYTPDPFEAILERRKLDSQKKKEQESKTQADLKIKKQAVSIASKSQAKEFKVSKNLIVKQRKYQNVTFPRKVWSQAPFVDLKLKSHELIMQAIRAHVSWTSQESHLESQDADDYRSMIVSLGFRPSHVDEALRYTTNFTDALEWLIFHLPEDDLPPAFAKDEKVSNLSLTITGDLKKEYMAKRLISAGFDYTDVDLALMETDFDEVLAATSLTYGLANYENDEINPDSWEIWGDEMQSMEVIYSERFKIISDKICEIELNCLNLDPGVLSLRVFKSDGYPTALPGLMINVTDPTYKLANYIKISITRSMLMYILDNGLLGDSFIFSCVDWLENECYKIIEDPGPLFVDVEASSKTMRTTVTKSKTQRSHRFKDLTPLEIKEMEAFYKKHYQSSELKLSLLKRATLPAWSKKDEIVSMINANDVTLITGETGSGKSTQAVQFILDDLIEKGDFKTSIICTQPRRISTIGLAERISDERCGQCGKEVGYIIRGENKTTPKTRISFVTTGVLLRMVQGFLSDNAGKDSFFNKVGYIFIDEVHERSIDSDFLLIILKKILTNYPNLKIVLMSATTDVNIYRKYFDNNLAHTHIEGRTFPIQDYYLPKILEEVDFSINVYDSKEGENTEIRPKADSRFFNDGNINNDLIAKVVNMVHLKLSSESNSGSMLIFLPGVLEINSCIRTISKNADGNFLLLPLHSALSSNDQKKVFKIPPRGVRKIVVATNVAETSITIPDAVCVIDTGRAKSLFYDPKMSTTRLVEDWCSQAEVGQRRGRAGRITNGNCYKLYTKETENKMLKQPIPEIKRIRLENVYLVVKSIGIDQVEEFLNSGLDPPDSSTVKKTREFLDSIGAIVNNQLTHLGSYLSMLPTDLQSGKLLIFGTIFGCLENALTLASIASTGSPFINSFDERDAIKKVQQKFSQGQGDLIAIVNAFNEYDTLKGSSANKWLSQNYLSFIKFKEMRSTRSQYISILKDLGFVPLDYDKSKYRHFNRNNQNYNIIKTLITSAFYPQIARVQLPDPKFLSTFSGAIAVELDARETKLWIKNENYNPDKKDTIKKPGPRKPDEPDEEYPASRAFLHPSSCLFVGKEPAPSLDGYQAYDQSQISQAVKSEALKSSFAIYYSSMHTTRFYLRDITPSSTLAVLLFGGELNYDLSGLQKTSDPSPGIILDGWLPIRTWCKNAVLIKKLRQLLDNVISEKLESPVFEDTKTSGDDVLDVVEKILEFDAVN